MSQTEWSEQEEAKIAELMKEKPYPESPRNNTRIEAIRAMQRMKKAGKWRPTDV